MSAKDAENFESLFNTAYSLKMRINAVLNHVGHLIDLSGDLGRDDGLTTAFDWCNKVAQRKLSGKQQILLYYLRANVWHNKRRLQRLGGGFSWSWEQPELQEEIINLRRAANHPQFNSLDKLRRCQILTNLGNQLNEIGRFIEAVSCWNRVLELNSRFGMAHGNLGMGLFEYARVLYGKIDQVSLLKSASHHLAVACSDQAQYESPHYKSVRVKFNEYRLHVDKILKKQKPALLTKHKKISSKAISYRKWCLYHGLMLNPLNDLRLGDKSLEDALLLPALITSEAAMPMFFGFFNQIKQEFVSARWLFYDGWYSRKRHFSDYGVSLYNTLDYPSYCLAVEKIKASYRMAYSLFDKIAFFLNSYFTLGHPPNSIYFKNVWFQQDHKKKRILHPRFSSTTNWSLRGLYWLSKDLFQPDFAETIEPEAKELFTIRNHMEHKRFQVHEIGHKFGASDSSYLILRTDLESKTLKVLTLVRSALIYLMLAVHHEEKLRSKKVTGKVAHMPLDLWLDKFKI